MCVTPDLPQSPDQHKTQFTVENYHLLTSDIMEDDDILLDDYSQNSFDMSDEDEGEDQAIPNLSATATTSNNTNNSTSPQLSSAASAATSSSAATTSISTTRGLNTATDATPLRNANDSNSFMSRLNALSANRTGSTTSVLNVSRTQPVISNRSGSPVRTRLEKLSNRLAARAQQIAQEKRERESAILDHVQAMERKLDAATARMQDMERQHQTLQEELAEERKARISLDSNYQEEIANLTHRLGRMKQDLDKQMEDQHTQSSAQMQAFLEDAANSVGVVNELSNTVSSLKKRVSSTEQELPEFRTHAIEARRMVEIERRVKTETEGMLMKLLDDTFTKFRGSMAQEKETRERNEEAMLQILENMSDTGAVNDL